MKNHKIVTELELVSLEMFKCFMSLSVKGEIPDDNILCYMISKDMVWSAYCQQFCVCKGIITTKEEKALAEKNEKGCIKSSNVCTLSCGSTIPTVSYDFLSILKHSRTSSQKLGRHASHRVRSIWKKFGFGKLWVQKVWA